QRGTPSLYQGDELGVANRHFTQVAQLDDVQVKNAYQNLKVAEQGLDEQFLAACNRIARDHARAPLPWQDAPNAIYDYYRQLIQLRKTSNALTLGHCVDLDLSNNEVWAYTRQSESEQWLVVCNFTAQRQVFELPPHLHTEKSVWRMGNYAPVGLRPTIGLKPYEALVYQLFG
ncbi:MAG: DUF3459 domain-containing protein, partial [Runella slithyformis]